jgi:hypothetical protein
MKNEKLRGPQKIENFLGLRGKMENENKENI